MRNSSEFSPDGGCISLKKGEGNLDTKISETMLIIIATTILLLLLANINTNKKKTNNKITNNNNKNKHCCFRENYNIF